MADAEKINLSALGEQDPQAIPSYVTQELTDKLAIGVEKKWESEVADAGSTTAGQQHFQAKQDNAEKIAKFAAHLESVASVNGATIGAVLRGYVADYLIEIKAKGNELVAGLQDKQTMLINDLVRQFTSSVDDKLNYDHSAGIANFTNVNASKYNAAESFALLKPLSAQIKQHPKNFHNGTNNQKSINQMETILSTMSLPADKFTAADVPKMAAYTAGLMAGLTNNKSLFKPSSSKHIAPNLDQEVVAKALDAAKATYKDVQHLGEKQLFDLGKETAKVVAKDKQVSKGDLRSHATCNVDELIAKAVPQKLEQMQQPHKNSFEQMRNSIRDAFRAFMRGEAKVDKPESSSQAAAAAQSVAIKADEQLKR